ncbi:MAG: hypothetical protein ABWY06_17090 [Pseudomonas sp.]|uniref:hypothetical protein n=1 Tax=Pseudomonas sp. TaxID=306 RepID=UPI0033982A55
MRHPTATLLAGCLFGLTLLLFAIPFAPRMPEPGLDPSFAFAVNMAQAQGLGFGRELIFTLGPYASTYTTMYHPDTDALMLLGGAVIGLGYLLCALLLAANRSWLLIGSITLTLALLLSSRDAFLLCYPLAACLALVNIPNTRAAQTGSRLVALYPTLLSAPFGLLILIKGSFAVLCLGLLVLSASYLACCRHKRQALLFTLSPLATLLLLWNHADQQLVDLPAYVLTQIPMISGFTEAMSVEGSPTEMLLWGASALALLAALLFGPLSRSQKGFLAPAFCLLLLISFKAGFVRHDMHAVIASDALLLISGFLLLLMPSRGMFLSLLLLAVCWSRLDEQHPHVTAHSHIEGFKTLYLGSAIAAWQRLEQPERLATRYTNTLSALHTRFNFPKLPGSVDIYSVNQAELFASGNRWNPRPIFQSYSVYTPTLQRLNAQHQAAEAAADSILFRMEPIDGRLPALEDGPSWLALFRNYQLSQQLEKGYLQLDKRPTLGAEARLSLGQRRVTLGQVVDVPISDKLVLVKFDLTPSLYGRIRSLLYKTPPLSIELELSSGEKRSFRFIANMAGEPFLLSPAVFETADFAQLYMPLEASQLPQVRRFRVDSAGSGASWQASYGISFSSVSYPRPAQAGLPERAAPPIELSPDQLNALDTVTCEGQIDSINAATATPNQTIEGPLLEIIGWNTVSGILGLTPEAVFIGVHDATGKIFLYRTVPSARADVSHYFAQPALAMPGYSAVIPRSQVPGKKRLDVFRINAGVLERCQQQGLDITF